MAATVYSRALQKASELLGGRQKLARYLRVPERDLELWIAQDGKPPIGTFLRVVDLIIDETPPPGSSSDPGGDAPPSRDCSAAGSWT